MVHSSLHLRDAFCPWSDHLLSCHWTLAVTIYMLQFYYTEWSKLLDKIDEVMTLTQKYIQNIKLNGHTLPSSGVQRFLL